MRNQRILSFTFADFIDPIHCIERSHNILQIEKDYEDNWASRQLDHTYHYRLDKSFDFEYVENGKSTTRSGLWILQEFQRYKLLGFKVLWKRKLIIYVTRETSLRCRYRGRYPNSISKLKLAVPKPTEREKKFVFGSHCYFIKECNFTNDDFNAVFAEWSTFYSLKQLSFRLFRRIRGSLIMTTVIAVNSFGNAAFQFYEIAVLIFVAVIYFLLEVNSVDS